MKSVFWIKVFPFIFNKKCFFFLLTYGIPFLIKKKLANF